MSQSKVTYLSFKICLGQVKNAPIVHIGHEQSTGEENHTFKYECIYSIFCPVPNMKSLMTLQYAKTTTQIFFRYKALNYRQKKTLQILKYETLPTLTEFLRILAFGRSLWWHKCATLYYTKIQWADNSNIKIDSHTPVKNTNSNQKTIGNLPVLKLKICNKSVTDFSSTNKQKL